MGKLTHYVFKSVWHVNAPCDDVRSVLSDVMTYVHWWPEVKSVEPLGDGRYQMVARSLLPYELRFVSEENTGPSAPGVIDARLSGDLEGFARFTVNEVGGSCRLVYDQEVATHRALLNRLAPVARLPFRVNHYLMMKHGEAGLRTFMAGHQQAKGQRAMPDH